MTDYFHTMYQLFNCEDLFLIFLSIVMGLIIGAEREYKNKSAGLRTLMLVCVGSCTFTILSIKIGVANPDRLAANIITGIGFLGAGAIFKDENKINGVTTACTIWVTAALGMCIGSGHIYLGLLATLVVLFVLLLLVPLEQWIDRKHKIQNYKITKVYDVGIAEQFEKTAQNFNLKSYKIWQSKNEDLLTINWRIMGHEKDHERFIAHLFSDPTIQQITL